MTERTLQESRNQLISLHRASDGKSGSRGEIFEYLIEQVWDAADLSRRASSEHLKRYRSIM